MSVYKKNVMNPLNLTKEQRRKEKELLRSVAVKLLEQQKQ